MRRDAHDCGVHPVGCHRAGRDHGDARRHVAQALPFYNASQATIAAVGGDAGHVWAYLWIVCAYAFGGMAAAVFVFALRRRER